MSKSQIGVNHKIILGGKDEKDENVNTQWKVYYQFAIFFYIIYFRFMLGYKIIVHLCIEKETRIKK